MKFNNEFCDNLQLARLYNEEYKIKIKIAGLQEQLMQVRRKIQQLPK